MIQLSLFPRRGWALLTFGRLLEDADGLPSVRTTRAAALRFLRRSARGESAWLDGYTRACRVEIHPPGPDGRLTYVVL